MQIICNYETFWRHYETDSVGAAVRRGMPDRLLRMWNAGKRIVQAEAAGFLYPIAIMALNITDGVEGVAVESMAQQQTGCLHDFQMTTADMKKAETADAFLINGAGMEGFLDKISDQLPELPVIDSSTGIPLIASGEDHHHDGGEGHDHDQEDYNPHLWVSITNCMEQVRNLSEGIIALDPEHEAEYRENTETYLEKALRTAG